MTGRYQVRAGGSKYQNVRVEIDGITFASKREARRYGDLLILVRIGEIADLELQPRYPLIVNGEKVATYVADFRYRVVATGSTVVEDVKGVRTPVYRMKKKLIRALYGVEIVEIA
jgi:hypothetical protein